MYVSVSKILWERTLKNFLLLPQDIDLFLIIETEIKQLSSKSSMWSKEACQ